MARAEHNYINFLTVTVGAMLTKKKLFILLFGEFHTFEGDPFCWLLDYGTRMFRNPRQRYIAKIGFYFHVIGLLSFATYACLTKPEINVSIKYLPLASGMAYTGVNYGTLMGAYPIIIDTLQAIKADVMSETRAPSDCLKQQVNVISWKLKILFNICIFHPVLWYISLLVFEDKETHELFVAVRYVCFNQIVPQAIIHGLILPMTVLFWSVPLLIGTYAPFLITYLLKRVDEQMEILTSFETNYHDVSNTLNNMLYQKRIRTDMEYFLKRHVAIRKFINAHNDFLKWRFLAVVTTGGIVIGSIIVFIMSTRNQQTISYLTPLFTATIYFFVLAESGEQIQIQVFRVSYGYAMYFQSMK